MKKLFLVLFLLSNNYSHATDYKDTALTIGGWCIVAVGVYKVYSNGTKIHDNGARIHDLENKLDKLVSKMCPSACDSTKRRIELDVEAEHEIKKIEKKIDSINEDEVAAVAVVLE